MTDTNSRLDIQRIYVKDLSFESPESPRTVINQDLKPTIDIQLGVRYRRLDDNDNYEIVLTITVTAKEEERAVFLAEVQQAGLFRVHGFSDHETGLVLNVACPTVLLPFAREAIAEMVRKGGFPQLLISPVNFEVLYNNKLKQEQSQEEQSGEAPGPAVN